MIRLHSVCTNSIWNIADIFPSRILILPWNDYFDVRCHISVCIMTWKWFYRTFCERFGQYIHFFINPFFLYNCFYRNAQSAIILKQFERLDMFIIRTLASCQKRKIAGVHAPGMPGTITPPPQVSDPDMHKGTCVTHVPWYMLGSLTSGFLWSRRWGETFPAFLAHAQHAILRIW